MQRIGRNWALNRFRLAWAYVNWTTEPIQAEQMQSIWDMQVKHTSAWCSLSASSNTQLPGWPYQKPGQKRGAAEARLLERSGFLNTSCPFDSADADKLGSSPFIYLFFFSQGFVLGCRCQEMYLGFQVRERDSRWLGPLFALAYFWHLASMMLLFPFSRATVSKSVWGLPQKSPPHWK